MLGGEALPFEGETFDCVVSTWTLCSIADVGRALGEVYRVLRPGGRFFFLEHGLVARSQASSGGSGGSTRSSEGWRRVAAWTSMSRQSSGASLSRPSRSIASRWSGLPGPTAPCIEASP